MPDNTDQLTADTDIITYAKEALADVKETRDAEIAKHKTRIEYWNGYIDAMDEIIRRQQT
jgi:hypothetical protein